MNRREDPSDELQKIWRHDFMESKMEDTAMITILLQEKRRSFHYLVQGQNLAEYMLTLALAPLTALAAWKADVLVIQLGYQILTVTLVLGAAVIWLNDRKAHVGGKIELSVREYHEELLESYERRIRFLKSGKYWGAIPLFFGASLVILPALGRVLPSPWDIVMLSALLLVAWIGIWHMNDVRRVADLRQMKDEIQTLLEQMDRE